jgi:Fe-S cluster assembly iron-binding protein IscA
MALDEPRDNDETFADRGITYLIDKGLLAQVKPIKVDYVESPFGSGFSISSSMKQSGGCGSSSCSC